MHLNCHGNKRKLRSGENGDMYVDLFCGPRPLHTDSTAQSCHSATRNRSQTEASVEQEWGVTAIHRADEIDSNREPRLVLDRILGTFSHHLVWPAETRPAEFFRELDRGTRSPGTRWTLVLSLCLPQIFS
jgi:hypothetical protein